jgi:hypothetical protein
LLAAWDYNGERLPRNYAPQKRFQSFRWLRSDQLVKLARHQNDEDRGAPGALGQGI